MTVNVFTVCSQIALGFARIDSVGKVANLYHIEPRSVNRAF